MKKLSVNSLNKLTEELASKIFDCVTVKKQSVEFISIDSLVIPHLLALDIVQKHTSKPNVSVGGCAWFSKIEIDVYCKQFPVPPEQYYKLKCDLWNAIRHEVEHMVQEEGEEAYSSSQKGFNHWKLYLNSKNEIEAYSAGCFYVAKRFNTTFSYEILRFAKSFYNDMLIEKIKSEKARKLIADFIYEVDKYSIRRFGCSVNENYEN